MKINIEKNKEEIIKLLESTDREGMSKFIKELCKTDFFEAPASSKYHLNVPGGLAFHSLSVYKTLDKLVTTFWKGKYFHPHSRIICALLHDVCKVGIYHKKLQDNFEKIEEDDFKAFTTWNGEYKREDNFPIGHGEKSVITLLQYGLVLTPQEIMIIRWHMAMYDQSYYRDSNAIQKVCPEAKLLYFADDISTQYLEE